MNYKLYIHLQYTKIIKAILKNTGTPFRTFAPIVSAHPYCARESHATSCHVMHRARALSTKMNK